MVQGQKAYTRGVLAKIPGRDALLARIRTECSSRQGKQRAADAGGRYFYEKMLSAEIVARLYVRDGDRAGEGAGGSGEVSGPGGSAQCDQLLRAVWNGGMVAVGVSPADRRTLSSTSSMSIRARNRRKRSIARFGAIPWRSDNRSFFYNRMQKLGPGKSLTEQEQKSIDYLHVVGNRWTRSRGSRIRPFAAGGDRAEGYSVCGDMPESQWALAVSPWSAKRGDNVSRRRWTRWARRTPWEKSATMRASDRISPCRETIFIC